MNRQSLLEQKRQRLQELKQRRLNGLGSSQENRSLEDIVDSLQKTQHESKQVDVAIQVDIQPTHKQEEAVAACAASSTPRTEEKVTFDKGIQVEQYVEETSAPEEITVLEDVVEEEKQAVDPEPVLDSDDHQVSEELMLALKRMNKVIVQDPDYPSLFAEFAKSVPSANKSRASESSEEHFPFRVEQTLPSIPGRSISSMDLSRQDLKLLVVSYSGPTKPTSTKKGNTSQSTKIRHSPGLAVIYSLNSKKPFPEIFLECTAPITQIKFDNSSTPSKLIGGLSNGKVVIWDLANLEPDKIGVLPSLKSSVISSIGSTLANFGRSTESPVRHIHHASSIILIDQISNDSNSSILTVSQDGVINVWSTSLLATPKLNSIKLHSATEATYLNSNFVEPVSPNVALLMSQSSYDLIKYNKNSLSHEPEYKFLDRLVIGSSSGTIFRLTNNKEIDYIGSTQHDERISNDEQEIRANKILSLVEFNYKSESLILTSHLDWTLRLWRYSHERPILTIPTSSIITHICARPNASLQFVAVGAFVEKQVQPTVQFWDLSCRLMNPVIQIPIDSDIKAQSATTVKFSETGEKLIVGFNDGSAAVWNVDEHTMNATIKANTNNEVDDGISNLLNKG